MSHSTHLQMLCSLFLGRKNVYSVYTLIYNLPTVLASNLMVSVSHILAKKSFDPTNTFIIDVYETRHFSVLSFIKLTHTIARRL